MHASTVQPIGRTWCEGTTMRFPATGQSSINAKAPKLCRKLQTKPHLSSRHQSLVDGSLPGTPPSEYQWTKNNSAKSSAEIPDLQGTARKSELRRSVIVTMESKPSSSGRGPMKSMAIESHRPAGTGRGCKGPGGRRGGVFIRWQLIKTVGNIRLTCTVVVRVSGSLKLSVCQPAYVGPA